MKLLGARAGVRLLAAAVLAAACAGTPAGASDSAPVAPDAPAQVTAAPTPTARVFLSAPVGHMFADDTGEQAGQRAYAWRNSAAGSASVVAFSARPPPVTGLLLSVISGAPLAHPLLTSAFGVTRLASGGGTRLHAGVDLAAPLGSPVAAAMDGRVSSAQWTGGYGLLVTLDHPNGLQTRYAHLSAINVAPGQQVHQGEQLGRVGSTGHSTGPHLHYELRQNGRALNPLAR